MLVISFIIIQNKLMPDMERRDDFHLTNGRKDNGECDENNQLLSGAECSESPVVSENGTPKNGTHFNTIDE